MEGKGKGKSSFFFHHHFGLRFVGNLVCCNTSLPAHWGISRGERISIVGYFF